MYVCKTMISEIDFTSYQIFDIVSQFDVYNRISFLLHRYLLQNCTEVNVHLKLRNIKSRKICYMIFLFYLYCHFLMPTALSLATQVCPGIISSAWNINTRYKMTLSSTLTEISCFLYTCYFLFLIEIIAHCCNQVLNLCGPCRLEFDLLKVSQKKCKFVGTLFQCKFF
jgi:hypothetical protein